MPLPLLIYGLFPTPVGEQPTASPTGPPCQMARLSAAVLRTGGGLKQGKQLVIVTDKRL
ncbi:hypothetical protein NIT7321_01485 [Phaeobacter italicus]|jgi:hypothetical protein|uniref:Uncharacterized protein n=1 Tax=Phaeobacter italicus TaxID=481446 RepID=A0A0H5D0Q4_9RHOB|nr:hypothetical protein NIT7321_01485 [Phaeobacter italicus]